MLLARNAASAREPATRSPPQVIRSRRPMPTRDGPPWVPGPLSSPVPRTSRSRTTSQATWWFSPAWPCCQPNCGRRCWPKAPMCRWPSTWNAAKLARRRAGLRKPSTPSASHRPRNGRSATSGSRRRCPRRLTRDCSPAWPTPAPTGTAAACSPTCSRSSRTRHRAPCANAPTPACKRCASKTSGSPPISGSTWETARNSTGSRRTGA